MPDEFIAPAAPNVTPCKSGISPVIAKEKAGLVPAVFTSLVTNLFMSPNTMVWVYETYPNLFSQIFPENNTVCPV